MSDSESPKRSTETREALSPERNPEVLYLEALEKKRDTLLAFHTMNSFRKNKKIDEMTSEEVGKYNILKTDWQSKKESSFSAWDGLSEDKQGELSAFGSRLYDVQAELTLLTKEPGIKPGIKPEDFDATGPAVLRSEAPSGPIATSAVEKPARELTLDEIEAKIQFAKDTGRVPGVGPDGLSYWEARKDELLERQKAEREAKKVEELKVRIKELEDQLAKKQSYSDGEIAKKIQFAKDTGRVPGVGPDSLAYWEGERDKTEGEIEGLKKELKKLEKELESTEKGVGKSFRDHAKETFEKAKVGMSKTKEALSEKYESFKDWLGNREEEPKGHAELGKLTAESVDKNKKEVPPSKWGWFKERVKGFATIGFWEIFRAEQFRTGTGFTADGIEAYAGQVEKDKNLSRDEAEVYAWRAFTEAGGKKGEGGVDNGVFARVVNRKDRENGEFIDRAVEHAIETIKEKLGTERKKWGTYKGEAGQDVLTEANITAIKTEIRSELEKIRSGAVVKDLKDFRKLLRGNLDKKWWRRYMWGPAEAALWGAGIGYLTMPGSEQVISAVGSTATKEAAVEAFNQTLNQNVWHTLETMSKVSLSPQQLVDLSQQVLDANGMFEQEWTGGVVNNLLSSRSLPVGMQIKIPLEVMRVMGYIL